MAQAPRRRSGPRLWAGLALARAVGSLSRRSGRGGGTTLPGRLLLRLDPAAIARLGARLTDGSTVISATNGKTTTAGMLAGALREAGRNPVHNRAGSNMTWGVATALAAQSGTEGLFEADEAWLPRIVGELNPRLIVLANLFRDQLDRYGELEHLADEWAEMVEARQSAAGAGSAGETGLVLNADDPLVADLGRDKQLERRPGVTYFGIDDASQALPGLQHAHDAKHCRRCGAPYEYARAFVGHLGHYSCPECGADRPEPDVVATRIELDGMRGSHVEVATPNGPLSFDLPLPGLYNVYNALAALAAALRLDVTAADAVRALERVEAVFGRVETVAVADCAVSILLIKNPAGANEVLRTLGLESERPGTPEAGVHLWIALNDKIADGRDVSWIWDADFELLDGAVERVTCAGTRAAEMAVRLKYAGVPSERIVVRPEIETSLNEAVAAASGRLFALPTYTALIELRTMLAERGLAKAYWA
jgi:UDP-N-acetylmuramyl tripeptide synthase